MKHCKPGILLMVAFIIFIPTINNAVYAATCTWVGGATNASTSWNTAANWNPANVPGITDDVVIPASSYNPLLDASFTINSLTISGNSMILSMDGTHSLTVSNDVIISSSTAQIKTGSSKLKIYGSISGTGTLDMSGNGILQLNGNLSIAGLLAGEGGTSLVIMSGGNQIIYNSYEFNNLQIGTTSTTSVTLNANQQVDITLSGSGTLSCSTYTLELYGDMTVKYFNAGTGTVILNGIINYQSQDINGYTFYNLSVNNLKTYLVGNVTVSHSLDFQAGNINLRSYNFIISPGASLTWNGNTSINYGNGYFVTNGSGHLTMTATNTGTIFPVGPSSSAYNPITITTSIGTVSCNVSVSTGITDETNTAVTSHAVNLTWMVIPSSTIALTAAPQWTDGSTSGINEELTYFNRMYDYVAERTSLTSTWSATSYATYSTGSNPYYRTSGLVNMNAGSLYYFGVIDGASALPVTLTDFNAFYDNGVVDLKWSTASEINNNYFEIERSGDGTEWTVIGKVDGHGNSQSENNYQATDNLQGVAYSGIIYYRLKQVDYNSEYTFSRVRPVNIGTSPLSLNTYPNPVKDICNVIWNNGSNCISELTIVNLNGITLFHEEISSRDIVQKQINLGNYPPGMYFIQIETAGNTVRKTIYKN